MSSSPTYFGEGSARSFGWLHLPDTRQCRAGVILCPSLSVEAFSSHDVLRLLALGLERRGIAVLRFDYPGTGDSPGSLDAQTRLHDWMGAICSGVELLGSLGAGDDVGILGFRLGALLASTVLERVAPVRALALWDLPASGRSFLREQRALRRLSIGEISGVESDDQNVELLGTVLPSALAAELQLLTPVAIGSLVDASLVLVREDRPQPSALEPFVADERTDIEFARGEAELLDVLPGDAIMPTETISFVIDWFDRQLPTSTSEVSEPEREPAAIIRHGSALVLERPITFGALGLFGIISEPLDAPVDLDGASAIFLNAGVLHHIGPGRLWVDLARQLAASGLRTLRFDLGGIGDSPDRPDQQRRVSYPIGAFEDVEAAVAAVAGDPHRVVLAGLCSGAYHGIEAGLRVKPAGVVLLNPVLSADVPESRRGDVLDPGVVLQPFNPLIRRLRENERLRQAGERYVPSFVWDLFDRVGFQRAPARAIEALVAAEIDTLMICGQAEAAAFLRRSPRQMRRLGRATGFAFHVLDSADHTLFASGPRLAATTIVVEHLLNRRRPAVELVGI